MRTIRRGPVALTTCVVVAGLLNLASPPVAASTGPFTDVGAGHPFAANVAWVAGEGIAQGYDDGTFRPSAPVSRQAMAAFLHRLADPDLAPAVPSEARFSDVGAAHPFFADVEWVAGEGIAQGYDDGTFRPSAPVSRQAMAAFLHRFATRGEQAATLARMDAPVVLTGAALAPLAGVPAADVVGHRWLADSGWEQVPVQVDERKVANFGQPPSESTVASGAHGTVFGTPPLTPANPALSVLQYAGANTFVGPDPDPTVDADDELAFMLADTGDRAAPTQDDPPGAVAGSAVELTVADPTDGSQSWLYVFEDDGSTPALATDHVSYTFSLGSGPYLSTYQVWDGPNPESSLAATDRYEVRFTDRWMDGDWRIQAGDASGVDLLDGLKLQFSLSSCGRSNQTFSSGTDSYQGWGAIAATIDGPVRAVRSVIGANSGPYTQRTNVFYHDRQDIVTDLRVHAIPSTVEYLDLSPEAVGMTYQSSTRPAGVAVDGVPDPGMPTPSAPGPVPDWEVYSGEQGTVQLAQDLRTSDPGYQVGHAWIDRLDASSAAPLGLGYPGCWDDDDEHIVGGSTLVGGAVANTDPRSAAHHALQLHRYVRYLEPPAVDEDPGLDAALWEAELRTPVQVSTRAL